MGELGNFYWSSFVASSVLCLLLQLYARSEDKKAVTKNSDAGKTPASQRFSAFQRNYILVYLLAMFADWLQGPYVYELYVSYGFDQDTAIVGDSGGSTRGTSPPEPRTAINTGRKQTMDDSRLDFRKDPRGPEEADRATGEAREEHARADRQLKRTLPPASARRSASEA